jgi:hypothetical protein
VEGITSLPRVDIIYACADMPADLIDGSMEKGAKGIVVAGDGNGNMNAATIERAAQAAKKGVMIVRSSRVPTGKVGRNVEIDDDRMRFIASDELNPAKARILLMLALLKKRRAITDVHPVGVGHVTVIEDKDIRTGATAIVPHADNVYQNKVPAGIAVGNGYGKLMGSTQIRELGEIETPIVLTNTLCVPRAADAIVDWVLAVPGNETVTTVNPVVGETNDGRLNDIRRRPLTAGMIRRAIEVANPGPVREEA